MKMIRKLSGTKLSRILLEEGIITRYIYKKDGFLDNDIILGRVVNCRNILKRETGRG
ncbi:MAG: hypothetical protein K0S47_1116 [Herbinix sp.]|nr:hypothetical protein [Herbinix sp.]